MVLLVFDIDDTLTKSEYQHQFSFVNSMKNFGITNINQNWKDYIHHTDSYILKENYEVNKIGKFDFSFIDIFEKYMMTQLQTLDKVTEIQGAQKIIANLQHNTNYAISFATGSLLNPALLKLKQAGIWHDENIVASSNKIFERENIVKDAIEKAKSYYKVSSFERIISIGDGIWDLKTAKNLNIEFIGIGLKNFEDFKKENIKVHTTNWSDFDFSHAENLLFK